MAGYTYTARTGVTYAVSADLITRCCSECSITYAIPAELRSRCVENGEGWYCPNGHHQSPVGLSTEQKLTRERERAARLAAERDQAEASARAHKGVATRLKNRAHAGLCPHCNRHFKDLERHVKGQHPEAE